MANWIKVKFERDRQVYVLDLDRACAFSLSWNGRLTVYLDTKDAPSIVLTKQSEPEAYEKVMDYIIEVTGYDLS